MTSNNQIFIGQVHSIAWFGRQIWVTKTGWGSSPGKRLFEAEQSVIQRSNITNLRLILKLIELQIFQDVDKNPLFKRRS